MTTPSSSGERLLSHRLRGFDARESTRRGLERALAAGVRHVEFDIRFTKDGHPVAYHDPFFRDDAGHWRYIDEWDLSILREQRSLSDLATLEEMCESFAESGRLNALIHIDVKVTGHEAVIHDVVAKSGLLPNAVLVSWLPSVLARFNSISPTTRLCFSHLPMVRAPWLYPVAKAAYPLFERYSPLPLRFIRSLAPRFSSEADAVSLSFHDSGDPVGDSEGEEDRKVRRIIGHVVPGMLTGTTLDVLRRNSGMVCVPNSLATRALADCYHSQGVQFAVYSVNSASSLQHVMARVNPDIVYVDNAGLFARPDDGNVNSTSSRTRLPING